MNSRKSIAVRYGIAVLAVSAAILLRWAVDPWLGNQYPFVTVLGAVGITAWAGGVGPGVMATAAGYGLANYLFIAPRGSLGFGGPDVVIAFFVYLFICAMLIGFSVAVRHEQRKADTATNYLKRALQGARMVAWEWEPATDRFTVTENAQEFFGLRRPMRRAEEALRHIHPADAADHAEAIRNSLRHGRVYHCTCRLIRPLDGQTIWVEEHGDITRGADGRALKLAGIAVDITARKKLEDLLLRRAEELREADYRKNEFLVLLADELRNPLEPMRARL